MGKHFMRLLETHETRAETWECPECGRRVVISWDKNRRIALTEGDEMISHRFVKIDSALIQGGDPWSGVIDDLDFGDTD